MDFENRLNSGSVRRLRDSFESKAVNNTINLDNNCINNRNNNKIKIKNELNGKTQHKVQDMKPIINSSFAEKLNKTLSNDKKSSLILHLKSGKSGENPFVSDIKDVKLSPKYLASDAPNPLPKPPRTFAHDLYMELKFNNNNNTNNVNNDNILALYAIPNKANKWKNRRNRSQSDSQVIDNKKTDSVSNEHIYDDCIFDKNCDKPSKLGLLKHFSCLKLK